MSLFRLFQNPYWIIGRRIAMVVLIIVLGLRAYGGYFTSMFARADGARDVVLTRYEFRPDPEDAKPVWIIGLRNASNRFTYDSIQLEAVYMDEAGKIIERDRLIVREKLTPGEEQLVASTDIKNRPGATTGTLRVTGAGNPTK
jgi:hypothetical protein